MENEKKSKYKTVINEWNMGLMKQNISQTTDCVMGYFVPFVRKRRV